MAKRRIVTFCVFGFAFLSLTVARADTITFYFSGTTNYVDPLLSSVASPGNLITGSYAFDPGVPDTDPSDPTVGLYSSPTQSTVTVGTFTAQTTPVIFNIFDNLVLGQFYRTQYRTVLSQSNLDVNGLAYDGFTLDLWSTSTTPLSLFGSDALPVVPPSISDFENEQLRFYFLDSNGGVHYIVGDLDSLTAAPEPCTLLLLGSGLMAFAGRRLKSKA
jgi:hypothetical protein